MSEKRLKGCRGCGSYCTVPGCRVCVKRVDYCVKCERVYHETRWNQHTRGGCDDTERE